MLSRDKNLASIDYIVIKPHPITNVFRCPSVNIIPCTLIQGEDESRVKMNPGRYSNLYLLQYFAKRHLFWPRLLNHIFGHQVAWAFPYLLFGRGLMCGLISFSKQDSIKGIPCSLGTKELAFLNIS